MENREFEKFTLNLKKPLEPEVDNEKTVISGKPENDIETKSGKKKLFNMISKVINGSFNEDIELYRKVL